MRKLMILAALILAAGAVQASYVTEVTDLNPVSYWRLNETSGAVATDLMGANNGDYLSLPTGGGGPGELGAAGVRPTDGFLGLEANNYAPHFDGVNDSVRVSDSASLSITGALTLQAWINPDQATGTDTLISKYNTGTDTYSWTLFRDTYNRVAFGISSDGNGWDKTVYGTVGDVPDGQWSDVVAVFNPGVAMTIYVNGVVSGTSATSLTSIYDSTSRVGISGYEWGTGWYGEIDGKLDEVAIYASALTSTQVEDLHTAAAIPEPATLGLVGVAGIAILLIRRRF